MTGRDHVGRLAGYYPSAWPAECAGPRRQKITRAPGPNIQPGERLRVTSRAYPGRWPVMFVHRDPGELYLQGGTPGGSSSYGWVEQLDPATLEGLSNRRARRARARSCPAVGRDRGWRCSASRAAVVARSTH